MKHLDPATLASFQDGGLSPEERERATGHLADCAECRRRLAALVRAVAGREAFEPVVAGPIERERTAARKRTIELLAAAVIGTILLGSGLWIAVDRQDPTGRAIRPADEGTFPADPPSAVPSSDELAGIRSEKASETPAGRAPPAGPATDSPPATDLLALRGARRSVEGRTFRLQGEEWVDTSWRPGLAGPPPVEVRRGSPEYEDLVARDPRVVAWSEVGPRVVAMVDSLAYRIVP